MTTTKFIPIGAANDIVNLLKVSEHLKASFHRGTGKTFLLTKVAQLLISDGFNVAYLTTPTRKEDDFIQQVCEGFIGEGNRDSFEVKGGGDIYRVCEPKQLRGKTVHFAFIDDCSFWNVDELVRRGIKVLELQSI